MERRIISLNGTWDVVFDEREKLGPDCFRPSTRLGAVSPSNRKRVKIHKVNVPGVWEEARPFYDGVGFYRRRFDLPRDLAQDVAAGRRALRVRFGAVNYFAEVFLNGKKLGEHEGGYSPFVLDAGSAVRQEGNELVVRVIDPPRRRRIRGFRSGAPLSQSNIPTWKAGWYYNFGGIWQPGELIATSAAYVEDVFVQPQADLKTVKFTVTVVNRGPAGEFDLALELRPKSGAEKSGASLRQTVRLAEGANTFRLSAEVENPHPWSLEDPFLYVATVALAAGGRELDRLAVTCGLRHFTVEGGLFKLNGRRVALRGFLQQGVYPRHIVFADSPAEARRELLLVKKNGMNFVRAHLKPTPALVDLADEMGLLVHSEPPIGWIENTPETLPRCLREVEGMVLSQRNHPSIVMWGLLNEASHYRTFTPAQVEAFKNALSEHCRALDPTRIVVDNSGGDIGGGTKESTVGAHLPFAAEPSRMHDLHAYCAIPLPAEALEVYRGHAGGAEVEPDGVNFTSELRPDAAAPAGWNRPALYVSEFGAFENPPDFPKLLARYSARDRRTGLEDYTQLKSYWESLQAQFKRAKLGEVFGSLDKYLRAAQEFHRENIRVIVSAMRANPRNSGWVFTQLADASGEMFGAVDLWRQPRRWFKDLAEACRTPLVVPHITKRVVAPGETLGLNLRIVNEDKTGGTYTWKLAVRDGRRQAVHAAQGEITARGWVQEVLDRPLDAPTTPGRYTVEAELRDGSKLLSRNSIRFTVIEPMKAPIERVGMFDLENEIRPTLEALGIPQIDKGGNNYRHKNVPCVYVMRAHHPVSLLSEYNCQLRRIVTLGGAALVLEAVTPMLYNELLPKIVRLAAPMRNLVYMRPSRIWDGLPTSGGFMDYDFADVFAGRSSARNNSDDLLALGGTSLCGGLCAHIWTNPDVYQWGSLIDLVPIGRGHLILCQLSLVQQAKTNPVAARLLGNLLKLTASLVKPGGEERLLSRCIDPV